jgi:hypothetical protein
MRIWDTWAQVSQILESELLVKMRCIWEPASHSEERKKSGQYSCAMIRNSHEQQSCCNPRLSCLFRVQGLGLGCLFWVYGSACKYIGFWNPHEPQ